MKDKTVGVRFEGKGAWGTTQLINRGYVSIKVVNEESKTVSSFCWGILILSISKSYFYTIKWTYRTEGTTNGWH